MNIKNFHIPIILISIIIAFISNYGSFVSLIEPFTFLQFEMESAKRGFISFNSFDSTYFTNNEWWRLLTPMFIHFSFAHLAFNCLWIYVLGSRLKMLMAILIFLL